MMLIIAHRGASGYAPENTLAAMKLAVEQNCDGIEMDVQLTKDGHVVVHHDWTVDRTTNGTGAIKDLTLEEIRSLDAGVWFSDKYRGEKVPTLEEVFIEMPKNLMLNVELKAVSLDNRDLEAKVVELLEKYDRMDATIISSFNHLCLKRIREISPKVKIAVLYEAHMFNPYQYLEANNFDSYSLHPCHYYTTSELVQELHGKNIKVYTWTVNETSKAELLRAMGVDGIITNYPDMLSK